VADELYVTWRTIPWGGIYVPVDCGNEVKELCKLVRFLCPALRLEHVMSQRINVVPLPVGRAQKSLHMTPRAPFGVCVGACTFVNEANAVVNGAVSVTFRVEIPVRRPAINDNRSAGFDPCIYNGLQSVSDSVRNGSENRFTGLALNSAKHPLSFNRVAPIIFAQTKLAFVDFDRLVRTADLLIGGLHVRQHRLSAEQTPFRDCIGTEAMVFLYNVGR